MLHRSFHLSLPSKDSPCRTQTATYDYGDEESQWANKLIQDCMRHSSFTAFQTRSIIQEILKVQRINQTIWKATITSDQRRMLNKISGKHGHLSVRSGKVQGSCNPQYGNDRQCTPGRCIHPLAPSNAHLFWTKESCSKEDLNKWRCKMIPKESLHCRNTQLIKVKQQDAAMDGYKLVALVGIPIQVHGWLSRQSFKRFWLHKCLFEALEVHQIRLYSKKKVIFDGKHAQNLPVLKKQSQNLWGPGWQKKNAKSLICWICAGWQVLCPFDLISKIYV